MKPPALYFKFGLLVALLVLFFDQFSKWYVLAVSEISTRAIEVTPFFNLVLVWNYGISFGMFSNRDSSMGKYVLIALALVIIGILLKWLINAVTRVQAASIGLVVGGAVGNIIDRILYGAVADFLDFHIAGWHWPAFNVADSAICIGVIVLCCDSMFDKRQANDGQTQGINT